MNNDTLHTLIRKHQLARKDVARLCRVSIHTVHSWLRNDSHRRNMPDAALALLILEVAKK